jgi:hypothetical protein
MSPTFSTKGNRRYRYYTCVNALQRGWSKCPSKSVPAGEVERFVLEQLSMSIEGSAIDQAQKIRQLLQRVEYDGATGRLAIILQDPETP